MHDHRTLLAAGVALAVGMGAMGAEAATEVQWWHAMGGQLGERVGQIAADFNASQDEYVVTPVFKGTYTESSAGYAGIKANATGFEFGVGMLPYDDTLEGAPQNSIIGGATLWVLQGRDEAEYQGVARFFSYLSSPEVQAAWHQATG